MLMTRLCNIRSPTEVGAVLRILEKFGKSSGLRINDAKSIAISLRPETPACPTELGALKVLRDGEHCRYLGDLVGAGATGSANWTSCIRAFTTRLVQARLRLRSLVCEP